MYKRQVLTSPRLGEEERQSLLARIDVGDFPVELLQDIQRFIQGEMDANSTERKSVTAEGARVHADLQADEIRTETAEQAEVANAEKQMEETIIAWQAESDAIIRKAQQSQETGQRSKDAASIEALRATLKNDGK